MCVDRASFSLSAQNDKGESPFYFALKNRRWGLLRLLQHAITGESAPASVYISFKRIPGSPLTFRFRTSGESELMFKRRNLCRPSLKVTEFLMRKARYALHSPAHTSLHTLPETPAIPA